MTQEEKAKAYDEAIKKIRKGIQPLQDGSKISGVTNGFLEEVFPELKESEDERIRKEILQSIRDNMVVIHKDKCIAWLEKQGEQKSIWHNEDEEPQRDSLILLIMQSGTPIVAKIIEPNHTFNHGERWAYIDDLLEKQGEQKTIDKSEPKFHEGDWVVSKLGNVWYIDSFDNKNYKVTDINGNYNCFPIYIQDRLHLWTIQDAKDGDVLACPLPKCCESGEQIFIFKCINSRDYVDNCIEYYCRICEGVFYENENGYMGTTSSPLYPATKEQRDALFAKIKEAGYEWDAEKKELKKSADKQKFKVGDYVVISTTKGDKVVQIASVEYLKDGYPSYITTEGRWFGNGTKARILTDKDMETITIPERSTIVKKIKSWNEEDEQIANNIRMLIEKYAFSQSAVDVNGDLCEKKFIDADNWIKSLKERYTWKPSDEQMEALYEETQKSDRIRDDRIASLYNDLKKLKGE